MEVLGFAAGGEGCRKLIYIVLQSDTWNRFEVKNPSGLVDVFCLDLEKGEAELQKQHAEIYCAAKPTALEELDSH